MQGDPSPLGLSIISKIGRLGLLLPLQKVTFDFHLRMEVLKFKRQSNRGPQILTPSSPA